MLMEEDSGDEVDKIELSEISPVAFWGGSQNVIK